MHVYVCVHTYIYIYLYIYTYTSIHRGLRGVSPKLPRSRSESDDGIPSSWMAPRPLLGRPHPKATEDRVALSPFE